MVRIERLSGAAMRNFSDLSCDQRDLAALRGHVLELFRAVKLDSVVPSASLIVLKPNWVKEIHPRSCEGWRWVITDPALICASAAVLRQEFGFRGELVAADAPQTDSSFSRIMELCQFHDRLREWGLSDESLIRLDLRKEEWKNCAGVIGERRVLSGDPRGYVAFDLSSASEFTGHRGEGQYYGADYDSRELHVHHSGGKHEYLVSRTVIDADVLISMPKLKSHKKAGITGALKNLVGVNGDKNWLPHHTEPSLFQAGDDRPDAGLWGRLERLSAQAVRRTIARMPGIGVHLHRYLRTSAVRMIGDSNSVIRSGNWWGNDTVWRMCLDLNKIVGYGGVAGTFRSATEGNSKPHFVLMDAVIAGEGNGPMDPDPVELGALICGSEPAMSDAVGAAFMGFDPGKIPIVRNAFCSRGFPLSRISLDEVKVESNVPEWNGLLKELPFEGVPRCKPHFGWNGHIERESRS